MVRQVKAFMAGRIDPVAALDIGCGAGAHSWMMEREGMRVSAIDISPTAIARMPQIAPSALPFVGDISVAEWAPASFDFILDNLSLTHVDKAPLERIKSWLKPGGWLVSAQFQPGPDDAPPWWTHDVGPIIEAYGIARGIKVHGIQLQRWVKP